MANLLLQENCTVTIAHSRTEDIETICAQADIVIAAVGRPEMIRKDWVKPGATVIDVGINRVIKNIEGDESGEGVAAFTTILPQGQRDVLCEYTRRSPKNNIM